MSTNHSLTTNKVLAALLAFAIFLAFFVFAPHGTSSIKALNIGRSRARFHLLLPASSSNGNLCRLLLSTVILNYPVPVLINWDAQETEDPYDMHILKIQKVLEYLEKFPPDQQDDLVLMVDAFDVWFQLPPEVLIRRYYEQTKRDQALLISKYGAKAVQENQFRHTVFFGNDKSCWPDFDDGRVTCWAVPQSTMPKYAFGPAEDDTHQDAVNWGNAYEVRARWLNSGTILGPVHEVLRMYKAVAKLFQQRNNKGKSDQFYFAEVWGYQEYARLLLEPNVTVPAETKKPDLDKEISGRQNAEQHMTLDYDNSMFQPVMWYDPYLSFLTFDGSINSGRPKDAPIPYSDVHELAQDIKDARSPLAAIKTPDPKPGQGKVRMKEWRDLPLLTNLISKQVSPLLHFMHEKEYRIKWWDRMWFTPFSRDLFAAATSASDVPILKKPIGGKMWINAERPVIATNVALDAGTKDGAWSDQGVWLSWNSLCLQHQDYIFTADRRDSYSQG